MKLLITAFSLILVPIACAIQASPPEQASTPSIQGKVLEEPEGPPIRKANVQLYGRKRPTGSNYSAISDVQGQFTIDGV